jgi:ureidoglycolate lyase
MTFGADTLSYPPTTGVRRVHETPLIVASDASLAGYGRLVDDPHSFEVEIVRWPAQGWRPVDANSGDQGGVTEGLFEFAWRGQTIWPVNGESFVVPLALPAMT